MKGQRHGLQSAITAGAWEVVALALLVGWVEALRRLPPDALPALLEMAGGGDGY